MGVHCRLLSKFGEGPGLSFKRRRVDGTWETFTMPVPSGMAYPDQRALHLYLLIETVTMSVPSGKTLLMSPDLAKGLADCVGVLHGHEAGRQGSISVICDLIANPPGAPPPSWEIITKACKKVDARRTPMEPLTAPHLAAVAALPLQYVAAGGRSGISEGCAARGWANAGRATRPRGCPRGATRPRGCQGVQRPGRICLEGSGN